MEEFEVMFSLRFALLEKPQWASRYPVESDSEIELVKFCEKLHSISPQQVQIAAKLIFRDSGYIRKLTYM